ncbi:MAG: hypothetical protein H0U55_04990 [Rubrobacteraceae bacterium]|nr:hypothetical protein [Rubrobacteraceae bacterium]
MNNPTPPQDKATRAYELVCSGCGLLEQECEGGGREEDMERVRDLLRWMQHDDEQRDDSETTKAHVALERLLVRAEAAEQALERADQMAEEFWPHESVRDYLASRKPTPSKEARG